MTAVEWLVEQLPLSTTSNGEFIVMIPQSTYHTFVMKAKEMEKEQMEISDEEIEKAKEYHWSYRNGFVEGAKWYRERLKSINPFYIDEYGNPIHKISAKG